MTEPILPRVASGAPGTVEERVARYKHHPGQLGPALMKMDVAIEPAP